MKKRILVVGLVCLSAMAVAQSNSASGQASTSGTSTSKTAAPRDMATGQSSGKRMHKPMSRESSAPSVSEATATSPSAGKPHVVTGTADRESSAPSVSEVTATSPSSGKSRVATGDVNGDGRADATASGSGRGASQSNATTAKQPRSGHATERVNKVEAITVKQKNEQVKEKK